MELGKPVPALFARVLDRRVRIVINRMSTWFRECPRNATIDHESAGLTVRGGDVNAGNSTGWNTTLHRAMNAGLQKSNFGLAVEWPERRFQQFAAKALFADRADRRSFGFIPCNIEAIVGHGPRNLQ